jgi:hypothetical protein
MPSYRTSQCAKRMGIRVIEIELIKKLNRGEDNPCVIELVAP